MDLDKIEGLVKIIENSSLTEFTLKEGDMKITMSKLDHPPVIPHGMPMMPPPAGMPGMPPCEPAGMMPPGGSEQSANSKEEEKFFITSPIVGTFYSAPLPDAPAFVKVGDHVKNGQTVCILEAMKLMNEIQAEFDCEIETVLVSNEQKVEYGQPLFRVKKL